MVTYEDPADHAGHTFDTEEGQDPMAPVTCRTCGGLYICQLFEFLPWAHGSFVKSP